MVIRALAAAVACAAVTATVITGGPTAARAATDPAPHAVGVTQRTYVDRGRSTPANRSCPELRSRTLPTTVYYPAAGAPTGEARPDAPPDPTGGPYPLIVFAHGFAASPELYAALLTEWASAGYVVAAPTFPLSSSASPCGPIAGDVVNQPQDMSVVIDGVLDDATRRAPLLGMRSTSLRGLVDADEIGAAGHSNGAITTYGLVANTKRRDPRVRAAVVFAGTAQPYPSGKYDFAGAPPLLVAHGTADSLVPYARAEDGFNAARGPKGLLRFEGGDHLAPTSPDGYAATTDFFDAYLRGDRRAAKRLPTDQVAGATTMTFVAAPGSTTTVPTQPRVVRNLRASVTPAKQLTNGQQVTVTWKGYTPGQAVSVLQCNGGNRDLSDSAACDYANAKLLQPNPTGDGSVTMTVITGTVGDGQCDAAHPGCFIVVNNESSSDPSNSVLLDISFAK